MHALHMYMYIQLEVNQIRLCAMKEIINHFSITYKILEFV